MSNVLEAPSVRQHIKNLPPGVTMEYVEITPELATEWLERNTRNRKLDPARVSVLKGANERDEWTVNGDVVRFDENGVLIDGQHRLEMVVASNKPIRTFVISGLKPEAQKTIDTNKKRNFSDHLRILGVPNYTHVASATRALFAYEQNGIPVSQNTGQNAPTIDQLEDLLEDNPGLYEVRATTTLLPPSLATSLYYIFAKRTSWADSQEFFEKLETGLGLQGTDDPIYVLRKKLEEDAVMNRGRAKFSATARAAYTIKAFNAWYEGRSIQVLRWKAGGAHKEPFPTVVERTD